MRRKFKGQLITAKRAKAEKISDLEERRIQDAFGVSDYEVSRANMRWFYADELKRVAEGRGQDLATSDKRILHRYNLIELTGNNKTGSIWVLVDEDPVP